MCKDYESLKSYVEEIMCGKVTDYDLEGVSQNIQDLYDTKKINNVQYEELMKGIMELQ